MLTAKLMDSDAGVCVQFLKFNLISSLILSVLREDPGAQAKVNQVLQAAVDCPHRLTLLNKSQEFKKEKSRLTMILKDAK